MSAGVYVLLSTWSLGLMYFIYWKLKMAYFAEQMQKILEEAVQAELYRTVEPLVIRLFETNVKNFLLESKVFKDTVYFRWTNKESFDGNSNVRKI